MHKIGRCIFLVTGLLLTGIASALTPPDVPSTAFSEFTITWQGPGPNQNIVYLQERPGGTTTWTNIGSTSLPQGTLTITRAAGSYEYRTFTWEMIMHNQFEPDVITLYSDPVSVTVFGGDPPVFDEIEDQLDYSWRARSGHLNGDGLIDVYIERTSGDLDNGIVSQAILLGRADGTFARLEASASQLATAQSWVTTPATFRVGDFNLDEVGDLVVSGLPGESSAHILISTARFFERNASAVVPITEERIQFFDDLAGWVLDENHFDDAELPSQPGYNIKIIVTVQVCYNLFFWPICYSYSYVLAEADVSLEDLGLDDYLGLGVVAQAANGGSVNTNAQKTAPNGVSAYAAAQYYSPTMEALAAPMMTELGITRSLHGTYEEQQVALTNSAENLPQNADPDTLICVYWCTYQIISGYDYFAVISWVDVWTPIMMDGGFDEENFSKDAFDLSVVLADIRLGQDAISDEAWEQAGVILTGALGVTIDVPMPGDMPLPDEDAQGKKKLRRFGRLTIALWAVWEVVEAIGEVMFEHKFIYHYTDAAGVGFINGSGGIINPPSGLVFLTHIMYPKASIAEKLLALCNDPVVGFYSVRLSTSGASTSTRVQPKLCPPGTAQAGTLQPGGGWEQIAIAPQQAVQFYPVATDTTP